MTRVVIAGAGAFGTALAVSFDRAGCEVVLVGRSLASVTADRINPRLPQVRIPETVRMSDELQVGADDILMLAVPMQALAGYLEAHHPLPKIAVACCKGIDLSSGRGPVAVIEDSLAAPAAVLTGPSFADEIALGKPAALTLALKDQRLGQMMQAQLSSDILRLYLSDDPVGAALGGALKNVIAIACGICIGAGLGESARAALMTRGMAEIQRMALSLGARADTLAGLSGFGDLVLTCTSEKSRNFSYGLSLAGKKAPPTSTTEGRSTARAVVQLADRRGIEMPIARVVAAMVEGTVRFEDALAQLMSRPLTTE